MDFIRLPKMAISLPLSVLAVAGLIFVNEASFSRSSEAFAAMQEAQLTRSALNNLTQTVLDAEAGQRGYLLTGDERYLEPYTHAQGQVNQQLDVLRRLFLPDKDQLAEFGTMSRNIFRKLAELDLSIRMRRENNEEDWRFVLTADVGKEHMQAIRKQTAKLALASARNMEQGQAQIRQTLQLSRLGVLILAIVGLIAFFMYLLQSRALLNADIQAQESLKRERDQLDLQVRERTAHLNERGHLARELHDELGALLTAAKLDVARLGSRLGAGQPEVTERLTHLAVTLNNGIALKRRIVEDLRPSSLSHLGLVASLEILAREFEQKADLSITTDLEDVALGGSAQLTICRLVQESLTNIAKCAEATKIFISLHNRDGYITAEVKDNGKGFDASTVSSSSHGLTGMRHLVEAAGGRLTVTTSPQVGTTINAVLPKDRAPSTPMTGEKSEG